jgi:membrane-associated phospholipid phosphatase
MNTPVTQDLLVSNAIAIADSAELLFMTVDATVIKEPKLALKTFIGGTVLCSFGIELLFKCVHSLLNADTKFPSGHVLKNFSVIFLAKISRIR